MKSSSMPIDQYRMSMEARPLRVLYSKYNSNEISTSLQIVRPLGRIRKERRSSSVIPGAKRPGSRVGFCDNSANIKRVDISCDTECKMKQDMKTGQENLRNSDQNLNKVDYRENGSLSPTGKLRTQDFQHKFKIAAARKPGQESPPLKPDLSYNRKVINLPFFRINVKTYSGDSEVNKTVARTRDSLRKLMEIHRSRMKPANLMTANIRNYEFSAPTAMSRSSSSGNLVTPTLQPFPAKPMLKSRHKDRIVKQNTFIHKRTLGPASPRGYTEGDLKSPSSERDEVVNERQQRRSKTLDLDTENENGLEDSLWSVAIRPDTSLTLGSTMNHLDTAVKSPGSDELRELSEVFKSSDSQSGWPSYDEMQRLRSRSQSRTYRSKTTLSRPGTVLNDARSGTVLDNVPETPEECWNSLRNDYAYASPTGSTSPQRPVLRYTSKQPSFKLDPIIVPSHTTTECTMCNIYQRDLETTCPPNSPMSTQYQDSPVLINQDTSHGVKVNSGRSRHTTKPEVLQISRINMNDGMYVTDDGQALNYMKAKG